MVIYVQLVLTVLKVPVLLKLVMLASTIQTLELRLQATALLVPQDSIVSGIIQLLQLGLVKVDSTVLLEVALKQLNLRPLGIMHPRGLLSRFHVLLVLMPATCNRLHALIVKRGSTAQIKE